ncbi:MAG: hypothetical protein LBK94_08590 [Prevotellaceae bacterium]|jgi:hypothetical protein|nr:hypothetical protein [Prevotellaceae bacterium]
MARTIKTASDTDYVKAWREFNESFKKSTPVDPNESAAAKIKRIRFLEDSPEEWFKYYFPHYCTAEPAEFHKRATQRILKNAEWYEARAWSRELAKSARAMMEVTYLAMLGKVNNLLLVSATQDSAVNLLLPFKACFEANRRLINDYGIQEVFGKWEAAKFTIKKGCQFRALGWGQSPRGSRKDNFRPDFILIDDIDTDEECRNEDTMTAKKKWVEEALIPTRSISGPLRILVNGNIIHDNCTVKYLGEKADRFEIINIRDKDGKSAWAAKNSEESIDRVLSTISYESAQKEYFNNPMDGGDTFKNLKDGKVPRLDSCAVCIYADPATSNKDVTSGSDKAVGVVAKKGFDYFIAKVFLGTMSNARFVECLFECYIFCRQKNVQNLRIWIENNSLQNPFYEQVILPAIYERANATGVFLPIIGDDRDKKDKYTRIEGLLEPLNRLGHLIFNEKEAEDPNMKRLKAQFNSFSRKQKRMDGPDMVEGGVFKLRENEVAEAPGGFQKFKFHNKHKL